MDVRQEDPGAHAPYKDLPFIPAYECEGLLARFGKNISKKQTKVNPPWSMLLPLLLLERFSGTLESDVLPALGSASTYEKGSKIIWHA